MSPVIRCDVLSHVANAGKTRALRAVLRAYRRGAVLVAREQWRLFYETGRINKRHRNPDEQALAAIVGAANRVQMVRCQVVGILTGFLAVRADEFRSMVQRSTLTPEIKHQLHTINRWQAWFGRTPLAMKEGATISDEVRRLARSIMRGVLARHRRPDVSRINAMLDVRAATLAPATTATAHPLWVTISSMTRGQRIAVPLAPHSHFLEREGVRRASIQLNEDRDGA